MDKCKNISIKKNNGENSLILYFYLITKCNSFFSYDFILYFKRRYMHINFTDENYDLNCNYAYSSFQISFFFFFFSFSLINNTKNKTNFSFYTRLEL